MTERVPAYFQEEVDAAADPLEGVGLGTAVIVFSEAARIILGDKLGEMEDSLEKKLRETPHVSRWTRLPIRASRFAIGRLPIREGGLRHWLRQEPTE